MDNDKQNYIIDNNLTYAWGKALSLLLAPGVKEVQPLFITINNIENNTPKEDLTVRANLDKILVQRKKNNCHTVANTVFPKSLWNPNKNRELLFTRFKKIYPLILKNDTTGKKYGRYFNRMIRFGTTNVNQLDHLIKTRVEKKNNRRSALQASIFDPLLDHTDQRMRGFPCLQQVSFAPLDNGKLSVTGYYPYQYIFDRAYGNYLGLCWLGHFVAHELGMELGVMNCVAGIADLGGIGKTDKDIKGLNRLIKERIAQHGNAKEKK